MKKISKNKYNILLFGNSTYSNRGCEAIVSNTAKVIKEHNPENNITLATFDDSDKNFHKEKINSYIKHRWPSDIGEKEKSELKDAGNIEDLAQKEVIGSIKSNDLFFSIGGDNYCYGIPSWLFAVDRAVKKESGKKLVLWSASIDNDVIGEGFVEDISKFDLVILRESMSYSLLEKFVDSKKLMLAPDIAFSLGCKEVKLDFDFKNEYIGINISPLILNYKKKDLNLLLSIKFFLDYILDKYDFNILLIPHVYKDGNNDLDILRDLKDRYQDNKRVVLLEKKYDCQELKYIISKMRFLIAARTHASIAAYSSIVPTLVLGYSMKSKGIAKDIFGNYEQYVIPIQDLEDENKIIERFEWLVANEKMTKEVLKKKMPKYFNDSKNLFKDVIDRINSMESQEVTKKEECSGCGACYNACPVGAIDMKQDDEGFLYPVINEDICIDCGICKKVCPNNKTYSYSYEKAKTYACINNNEKERVKSSSGGIFSLLARYIIDGGGCVFGVAYENSDVKHIKIEKIDELEKIRGSKYVESSISDSYRLVKKELEAGRKVLFSGVPCQIEGLRNFLENKEYKNLYCVAVVCHGVPSKLVFNKYLNYLAGENNDITKVNFRNKDEGWKRYNIKHSFINGSYKNVFLRDYYMAGFLGNYFLRKSCYSCNYRLNKKSTADIILGDFWGIENVFPDLDDDKGISSVIINSAKGEKLFRFLEDKVIKREAILENIIRYNPSITEATPINLNRFYFFDLLEKMGFGFAVEYFIKEYELKKIKNDLENANRKIIDLEKNAEIRESELQKKDDIISDHKTSVIIGPAIKIRKKLRLFRDYLKRKRANVEGFLIRISKKYLNDEVRFLIGRLLPGRYKTVIRKIENKKWSGPLVSVVTPFYNHGKTVKETIKTVLGQTFQNFEYIIVNDGSSDELSNDVFTKIRDEKIIKINQKNSGVAEARNSGIKMAKGKYILCLDSDDKIDPTYLEKAVTILESSPHIDLVYSDMQFFGIEECVYEEPEFDAKLLFNNNIITTASVFKKSVWRKVGGYKSGIGFEDWEFWINLVKNGSLARRIPEPLFIYRRAAESRYIEDKKKKDLNISHIKEIHRDYFEKIKTPIKYKYIFLKNSRFINLSSDKGYIGEKNNKGVLILMPWLTFGGAETLIFNYANKIKENYNFSIITGIKSKNEWEYKFKEVTDNIFHLPNLFDSKESYLEFVLNYIKKRDIKIVHIIHNSIFYEMLPFIKKRFPNVKVIVTVFNVLADHFENSLKNIKYIDKFITDNSLVSMEYKRRDLDCEIIHNGIDCVDKFNIAKYERNIERVNMGIESDEMAIYFIGRLSPEKNPNIFLESAKRIVKKHRKIKFFIIGDGPMKERIKKDIISFGDNSIKYLGYQTDIPKYLSTADIFVLPSKIEGFPLSNIEAMAMGVCVISSDVGGVGDAIVDGENGFLMKPNSVEELIEKIEFIAKNRSVIKEVGKKARETVEKNFSVDILAEKYRNLYGKKD